MQKPIEWVGQWKWDASCLGKIMKIKIVIEGFSSIAYFKWINTKSIHDHLLKLKDYFAVKMVTTKK